jgi:mRNA interferase RelE/StbE
VGRYRVEFTSRADRDVRDLDRDARDKILERCAELGEQPRGQQTKKLQGQSSSYRARVGTHRILFSIDDDAKVVVIARVVDRKDAY